MLILTGRLEARREMTETPIARHFVACTDIRVEDEHHITLVDLVHAINILPGESCPCLVKQLCLYALLTNGRGKHELSISLVLGHGIEARVVHRWGPFSRDFGQNPLAVQGLQMRLQNLVFDVAGQYEFRLLCDRIVIAEEKIEVREKS